MITYRLVICHAFPPRLCTRSRIKLHWSRVTDSDAWLGHSDPWERCPSSSNAFDEDGGQVTHDEYHSSEIAATIYKKPGIPLGLVVPAPDGRPVRLLDGAPIKEWV